MMLNFDARGNVAPYKRIEIDYDSFREFFVSPFPSESTRHTIFKQYEQYTRIFSEQITTNFQQWIDGSFISRKTNPRDIDLVNLVSYQAVERKEAIIKSEFLGNSVLKKYGIDAYLLIVYPEDHTLYRWTKSDLFYWNDWFTKSRMSKSRKRYSKGYIEVSFSK